MLLERAEPDDPKSDADKLADLIIAKNQFQKAKADYESANESFIRAAKEWGKAIEKLCAPAPAPGGDPVPVPVPSPGDGGIGIA
jgi:hypothetical protein